MKGLSKLRAALNRNANTPVSEVAKKIARKTTDPIKSAGRKTAETFTKARAGLNNAASYDIGQGIRNIGAKARKQAELKGLKMQGVTKSNMRKLGDKVAADRRKRAVANAFGTARQKLNAAASYDVGQAARRMSTRAGAAIGAGLMNARTRAQMGIAKTREAGRQARRWINSNPNIGR